MRWLIVGPYVPERGSGPDAAAAFVAERLAAGDTVHVVSPRPTAAHVHHALDGLAGIKALWQIARAQSCDGLWLRVESGIVLHAHTDRRRALVERALLALLLRRFEERILDVGDVGLLPGGRAGRPVLTSATRFVVHREQDADALTASGADPARIERRLVAAPTPSTSAQGAGPAAGPELQIDPSAYPPPLALQDLPPDRDAIEAAVADRAQQLRAAREVAADAARDGASPTAG